MSIKYRAELTAEIDITYSQPDKIKEVFIDGDWKQCFWEFNDLEELTEHLSLAFHNETDRFEHDKVNDSHFRQRSIEGFGKFVKENDKYTMEHETTGKITISYEQELESGSAALVKT